MSNNRNLEKVSGFFVCYATFYESTASIEQGLGFSTSSGAGRREMPTPLLFMGDSRTEEILES